MLFGGNYRSVVLLGNTKSIEPLQHFFTDNTDYGYKLIKIFDLENDKKNQVQEFFSFVLENKIDEMYCSMSDLTHKQISDITYFADNNLKTLKFIPDEKQILSRNFKFEYYDYIPVISLRDIVLDETLNKVRITIKNEQDLHLVYEGEITYMVKPIVFYYWLEQCKN